MNGFINLYKSGDMTSSDAVVITRGILRSKLGVKNIKVGHLGALDPLGTGVLPITVGKATKLFDYMQTKRKKYIAGFVFNATSVTLDSGSEIIKATKPIEITKEKLLQVIPSFLGTINQIPPKFSAKSVNGQRAYDLARNNVQFELKGKDVEIYSLKINKELNEGFEFEIECSSGTYIRSIVRDIAIKLNTVGYMSYIKRLSVGVFDIADSVTVEDLKQDVLSHVIPIEQVLFNMSKYKLNKQETFKVRNGVAIPFDTTEDKLVIDCDDNLIGIANSDNGYIKLTVRLYEN